MFVYKLTRDNNQCLDYLAIICIVIIFISLYDFFIIIIETSSPNEKDTHHFSFK